MNHEVLKLMEFEYVNYRRATRLLKELGSYEQVINAPYQRLLEVHYVGEKTAKSIYHAERTEPNSLL